MWSKHPIFGTYGNFSFATAQIPHISPFLGHDAVQVLQAIKDLQNPLFFFSIVPHTCPNGFKKYRTSLFVLLCIIIDIVSLFIFIIDI